MKIILCLISLTCLVVHTAFAQTGSVEDLAKELETTIPSLLQKYDEPGVAVAYLDGCQVVSIRTYGKSNVAGKRRINLNTYFQTGSTSKTLTAWGVMVLVKRGKIQLDEPVEKYLRRWNIPDSEFDKREVTVRRLLTYTAGISVPSVAGTDLGNKPPSLIDELNEKVARAKRSRSLRNPV